MDQEKYIFVYGAAVQGIQQFIFRTDKLKDIVGASELVERICTSLFKEGCLQGAQPLVNAAGNIKCVFSSEAECRKAVREFPRMVMLAAPGITISQAVVKTTQTEFDGHFREVLDRLEEKLHVQRNRPSKSMTIGLAATERSRATGLPAVAVAGGDYIDEATMKKAELSDGARVTLRLCEKSFGLEGLSPRNVALNIADLTGNNDWIAVIHADGNGLGEVVRRESGSAASLHAFSEHLDQATKEAAQAAFKEVCGIKGCDPASGFIPFRPVVLGGDDMTMICRASLALPYVKSYLRNFEEATRRLLGADGLTACAGIAFVKSSYPFHYGYELAEMLCSQAKKVSKSPVVCGGRTPAPSSVMFYKVQGSFIEDFDCMVEKEKVPAEGHSFCFGPYFLNQQAGYWTIDDLEDSSSVLSSKDGNTVKTAIRKWMTAMHQDMTMAQQAQDRSKQILSGSLKDVFTKATAPSERTGQAGKFYPAADMIDVHTLQSQTTK